jgi:hypothetical protein
MNENTQPMNPIEARETHDGAENERARLNAPEAEMATGKQLSRRPSPAPSRSPPRRLRARCRMRSSRRMRPVGRWRRR